MEKTLQIEINRYNKVCLWFIPFLPEDAEVINSGADKEHPKASLNYNFDYEKFLRNKWKFHIDIGFVVIPFAKTCVRSSFSITCAEEHLFTKEILDKITVVGLETCIEGFNQYCKEHNMPHDWKLPDLEKSAKDYSETIIRQYFTSRKSDDERNAKLQIDGLNFTPGTLTELVVNGTFMVMDEIMFYNRNFNTKANRKTISQLIAFPRYYTLKLNSVDIAKGKVQLTWEQTVYFVLCLDCTLQLLLGEQFEKLKPAIEKEGFNNENINSFIGFGSNLLNEVQKHLKSSNASISNLNQKHDWNMLIK